MEAREDYFADQLLCKRLDEHGDALISRELVVQQLELLIIDRDLAVLVERVGFLQCLVEHIEESLHAELVHHIDLVELGHGKVEISGSHGNRSILHPRLLQELVCVVDLFQLVSNRLCADFALLQDLDQLIVLKELLHVGRQVL